MAKCKNCGDDFPKKRRNQMHCSFECKKQFNVKRLRGIRNGTIVIVKKQQFVNTTGFFNWKEYGENIII